MPVKKIVATFFVFLLLTFLVDSRIFATASTFTVCPTGTAGQDGCNYIGATGIQQAVNDATGNTTILVKAGTYNNTHISFNDKTNITLTGENRTSILDGNQGGIINLSQSRGIIIKSLTLKNGNGAIFMEHSSQATISANLITNGVRGINVLGFGTQADISNNILMDNSARSMDIEGQAQANVINNTIFQSRGSGVTVAGPIQSGIYTTVLLKNNIVTSGRGYGFEIFGDTHVTEQYNLVWNNYGNLGNIMYGRTPGPGTIMEDPKYVSETDRDLHIRSCSPAKNSGDPGILDPDGSRSDMGTFGGSSAVDFSFGQTYLPCAEPTPTPINLSPTPTLPQNCVIPTDRLIITGNVTLCPGTYNLPGDDAGALHIANNNLTIDGTGTILIGTNKNNYGIRGNNLQNVTIKNITIKNYYYGVRFDNSQNINIISSNLSENRVITSLEFFDINRPLSIAYGGGLLFNYCNGCLVKNSTMQNQTVGADWYNVTNSTFIDSNASWNKVFGLHLYASSDNLIKRNQIHHNSPICDETTCWGTNDSAGLLLVVGSHRNKIFANDLRYSGDGFFIGNEGGTPSNNNILIGNDGSFSPANAFETTFSDGNYYEGNYATNSSFGFWLGFSYNMTLYGNIASGNSNNGLDIEHGRNNQIIKNITAGNSGTGVKLHMSPHSGLIPRYPGSEHSQNNTIKNNIMVRNAYGVEFIMNRSSPVLENYFLNNITTFSTAGDHPEETTGNNVNNNNLACSPSVTTCNYLAQNRNEGQIDTDFTQNYWGTVNEAEIISKIYDKTQNPSYGEILYNPYKTTAPQLDLPALLIKYQNILKPTVLKTIPITPNIFPNCNTVSLRKSERWTPYLWDYKEFQSELTNYDSVYLKCQTPRAI